MDVTPVPVYTADKEAVHQPAAVIQVEEQQVAPLQLPKLKEFAAMAVSLPAPNAGAGLPAAPGQAGAANNVHMKLLFWHSALLPMLQQQGGEHPLLLMRPMQLQCIIPVA